MVKIRHGEIRASASFSHPILFGSFAAALFPILLAYYKIQSSKYLIVVLLGCLFFVYACSSSGPIVVLALGIVFIMFFNWKQYSPQVAKITLLCLISIHFLREKSLWHFLYVRLSFKSSSTGIHRYRLVEAAINEFGNWWMLGYGRAGADWHNLYWPWVHAPFTDVTNHYLLEGTRGGVFTMLFFIVLCYKGCKALIQHSIAQENRDDQWLWWGYAGMMIVHCTTFLSVSYFGQITMLFYLTVAVASLAIDRNAML